MNLPQRWSGVRNRVQDVSEWVRRHFGRTTLGESECAEILDTDAALVSELQTRKPRSRSGGVRILAKCVVANDPRICNTRLADGAMVFPRLSWVHVLEHVLRIWSARFSDYPVSWCNWTLDVGHDNEPNPILFPFGDHEARAGDRLECVIEDTARDITVAGAEDHAEITARNAVVSSGKSGIRIDKSRWRVTGASLEPAA